MPGSEVRVAQIAAKATTDAAKISAAAQEAVSKAAAEAARLQQRSTFKITIITAILAFFAGITPTIVGLFLQSDAAGPDCTAVLARALTLHERLPQVTAVVPWNSKEQLICDVNGKMALIPASARTSSQAPTGTPTT